MQHAIVFKLLIPEEIAFLRDLLYEFTKLCNKQHDSEKIVFQWNKHRLDILEHNQSTSECVWLGCKTQDSSELIQIEKPFDRFHVPNSGEYIFYGNDDKPGATMKMLVGSF